MFVYLSGKRKFCPKAAQASHSHHVTHFSLVIPLENGCSSVKVKTKINIYDKEKPFRLISFHESTNAQQRKELNKWPSHSD